MRSLWSAAMALALAGAAWADDETTPKKQGDPAALADLEARLAALEERAGRPQDEELERLKKLAAQERQKELEDLPRRVSELEKKQQQPTWDPFKFTTIASPDGNFTARTGGRIYIVGRHVFDRDDGGGGLADSFMVDDARIQLEGTFFKDFFYRLETSGKTGSPTISITSTGTVDPDGAGGPLPAVPVSVTGSSTSAGGTQFNNEIFVGYGGMKDLFTVQFGQYKQPFSQEETTSSRFIDFAERSLLNSALVVPQRDVGITFAGAIADNLIQWTVGAFNASGTGRPKNIADNNDEKDVVGRIFLNPFRGTSGLLKGLRLGGDVTVGDVDGPTTLGAITTGDYTGATIVPATLSQLDGLRTRYLGNFSWLHGPFSLRAEYGIMLQELVDGYAPASDFDVTAWYVAATWLLTGEEKALENRVKPFAHLNPREGAWGAVELAARICRFDADDLRDAALVAATANTEAREITVGLNWWLTHNMVIRFNWENVTFDEDLPVGTGNSLEDSQNAFYVRWQVDF